MYYSGSGVTQDYAEAVKWYELAALQGNEFARYNLGFMYRHGTGVEHDDAKAVNWYLLVADQGNAFAQFNLGFMFASGLGIPRNDVAALKWIDLAVSRLPADEKELRGNAFGLRFLITARLTPTQLEEAERLASEWMPK